MSNTVCDSESEASQEGDPIEVYRNLLKEIEENEKGDRDEELEITWGAVNLPKHKETQEVSFFLFRVNSTKDLVCV